MTINSISLGCICLAIFSALLLVNNPVIAAKDTTYRSPLQLPGAKTIDADEAWWMYEDGVKFIDVRNSRLFARGHVPGAIHLCLLYTSDAADDEYNV